MSTCNDYQTALLDLDQEIDRLRLEVDFAGQNRTLASLNARLQGYSAKDYGPSLDERINARNLIKRMAQRDYLHRRLCEECECSDCTVAVKLVGAEMTSSAVAGASDCDDDTLSFNLIWADGSDRDSVGDLSVVEGIDWRSRYAANPLINLDHAKELKLPIGSARDPAGNLTLEVDPFARQGRCRVYLYRGPDDHGKKCREIYGLVKQGILAGGSYGYIVRKAMRLPEDANRGIPAGLHLLETILLEISLTSLPANARTVVKALGPRLRTTEDLGLHNAARLLNRGQTVVAGRHVLDRNNETFANSGERVIVDEIYPDGMVLFRNPRTGQTAKLSPASFRLTTGKSMAVRHKYRKSLLKRERESGPANYEQLAY